VSELHTESPESGADELGADDVLSTDGGSLTDGDSPADGCERLSPAAAEARGIEADIVASGYQDHGPGNLPLATAEEEQTTADLAASAVGELTVDTDQPGAVETAAEPA
jgi:hypothetical protein